jgi:amino acid adenylation domain-containing protein
MYIQDLFDFQVEQNTDKTALRSGNIDVTYNHLKVRSDYIAHFLQKTFAINQNDVVATYLERSIEFIVSMLGTLKAQAACYPMQVTDPWGRILDLLKVYKVNFIITSVKLSDQFQSLDFVETIVTNEDYAFIKLQSSNQYTRRNSKLIPEFIDGNKLAFVFSTSGSTGKPKGVMLSHQTCCYGAKAAKTYFNLSSDDTYLFKSPTSFVSILRQVIWPLTTGGKIVIVPPDSERDFTTISRLIKYDAVSVVTIMPSGLSVLLKNKDFLLANSVRHVICGAEVLNASIQKEFYSNFPESLLHNVYASSETPFVAVWTCPTNKYSDAPLGNPLPNSNIFLVTDTLSPIHEEDTCTQGEICVSGPGVFLGYYASDNHSSDKFFYLDKSPSANYEKKIFRTGDRGIYKKDRQIYYLGRKDKLVKLRGYRIDLSEIENLVCAFPNIQSTIASIYSGEQEGQSKQIVCFCKSLISNSNTEKEIREYLYKHLPRYMVPSKIIIFKEFPIKSNGKINVEELFTRSNVLRGSENKIVIQTDFPESAEELFLIKLVSDLVPLATVKSDSNWFELGIDSIQIASIIVQFEQEFCKKINIEIFLQNPSAEYAMKFSSSDIQGLTIANSLTNMAFSWLYKIFKDKTAYIHTNPILKNICQNFNQVRALNAKSSMVKMKSGSGIPLFCVPGIVGSPYYLCHLSSKFDVGQIVYGFQFPGIQNNQKISASFDDLVDCCLESIRSLQAEGPYYIAGHSFGGYIAVEVARKCKVSCYN